jgi:hypothetical protein
MHLSDIDFHVLDLNILLPPPAVAKMHTEVEKGAKKDQAPVKLMKTKEGLPMLT